MNQAVREFLEKVEDDLKKELPRFDMAKMIGSNIDIFYKNPMHQRTMLANLKQRHKATITVGPHVFDLLVTPLMSGSNRTGFVVEWTDAKDRMLNFDSAAQMAAFGRSQSMIEFKIDGTIVNANDNFLRLLGYTLEDIRGRHQQHVRRSFGARHAAICRVLE
jgi:methyl-accepting chemotaxis protein